MRTQRRLWQPSHCARLDAAAGCTAAGPRHTTGSASLRGYCVDLGRHTWAGRLGLPLAGSPHEAAAEEIEARAAKHLAFQHLEAVDVPLDRARYSRARSRRL